VLEPVQSVLLALLLDGGFSNRGAGASPSMPRHRWSGLSRTGLTSRTGVPSIASRLRTVMASSSTDAIVRSSQPDRTIASRTHGYGAGSCRRADARRARRGAPGVTRSARSPRHLPIDPWRLRETRVGIRPAPGVPPRRPVQGRRRDRSAAIPPDGPAAAGTSVRSPRVFFLTRNRPVSRAAKATGGAR
jgi:hypothetical protein